MTKLSSRNFTIETCTGTIGGSLSSVLTTITFGDIAKTVVMAIIGTIVSFLVTLVLKKILTRDK